ncbi:hypothetical protein EXIGLDRAFT_699562 [Exidia glandulosa HHB12029]|uniref:Uncharacterized protein n=1 Tax=Exidia glandulosa HHB12029 TaxID=1314781 RepID=A0A165ME12_EXIGL|nr:hypothetical protein EXIGLDRAFT_699562 [Exidia glandulosa HHB12029]
MSSHCRSRGCHCPKYKRAKGQQGVCTCNHGSSLHQAANSKPFNAPRAPPVQEPDANGSDEDEDMDEDEDDDGVSSSHRGRGHGPNAKLEALFAKSQSKVAAGRVAPKSTYAAARAETVEGLNTKAKAGRPSTASNPVEFQLVLLLPHGIDEAESIEQDGLTLRMFPKLAKTSMGNYLDICLGAQAPPSQLFSVDPSATFQRVNSQLRALLPRAFEWMERDFRKRTGSEWDVDRDDALWRVLQAEGSMLGILHDARPDGLALCKHIATGKTKMDNKVYLCSDATIPKDVYEGWSGNKDEKGSRKVKAGPAVITVKKEQGTTFAQQSGFTLADVYAVADDSFCTDSWWNTDAVSPDEDIPSTSGKPLKQARRKQAPDPKPNPSPVAARTRTKRKIDDNDADAIPIAKKKRVVEDVKAPIDVLVDELPSPDPDDVSRPTSPALNMDVSEYKTAQRDNGNVRTKDVELDHAGGASPTDKVAHMYLTAARRYGSPPRVYDPYEGEDDTEEEKEKPEAEDEVEPEEIQMYDE